mmetsp:Transcript_23314/g.42056  ORF Transcript_23314/g.42056 Transcript_23314/m.42056 type:complete len:426 (+) Transcript_23314:35-1312(+)
MILLLATAPFRSLGVIALTLAWARSIHVNAFSTSSRIHSYNNLNAANKAKGAIPHSSSNLIQRTTLRATTNPSSHQGGSLPSLPDIRAAVIVPGFLTGKNEFLALSQSLNNMGIPTVVVPMPNWHWLPCLGGRSMRPMLERIDFTVRHLAGVAGDLGDFERTTSESLEKSLEDALSMQDMTTARKTKTTDDDPQLLIPNISYNIFDCYQDFRNNPGGVLEVGGSAEVDEYPLWNPKGSFSSAPEPTGKVALIGHSAGGWICRAYLSERNYGGKSYGGNRFVHSLITLGSPHGNAPGPAFKGVEWVNSEIMDAGSGVRALAVAGTGYKGDSSGSLTEGAYSFCMGSDVRPDGSVYDGDGVTPIESALAMKEYMPHADTMILDDVGHFCWSDVFGGETVAPDLTKYHREGRPWYGDDVIIEKWAGWL